MPDGGNMQEHDREIRWAPKVPREKIWQLYQNDARGLVDETLVNEVGWALYLRCQSVLLASSGRVQCPRCNTVFACTGTAARLADGAARCPVCSWEVRVEEYHRSRRNRGLIGKYDGGAFERFVERYPQAASTQERMLLIDAVIHAFHQSLKSAVPHRAVAANLIEGNHRQVVALLDHLAYGEASTTGLKERYLEWRVKMQQMRQLHSGGHSERER